MTLWALACLASFNTGHVACGRALVHSSHTFMEPPVTQSFMRRNMFFSFSVGVDYASNLTWFLLGFCSLNQGCRGRRVWQQCRWLLIEICEGKAQSQGAPDEVEQMAGKGLHCARVTDFWRMRRRATGGPIFTPWLIIGRK